MHIGFAGLAHSHPFTDAMNALELGAEISVFDPDPRARADFAERFGCRAHDTLGELTASRPDLIIATPHPDQVVLDVAHLAKAGTPVFLNKTVAASAAGLTDLDAAVAHGDPTLVGTSSVLRFAPALQQLRSSVSPESILSIRVLAQHDNAPFLLPHRRWQDDPGAGGGTLITVGIHAWEMLDVLLPGAELVGASGWTRRREGSATHSEDLAGVSGIMRLSSGEHRQVPVEALIGGLPGPDRYAIELATSRGLIAVELDVSDAAEELGFVGLVRAVMSAAEAGRSAVHWRDARVVVGNSIRAAEAARRG